MNEREEFWEKQIQPVTNNPFILKAFKEIDRAEFIPYAFRRDAYRNIIIPLGDGSSLTEPVLVAQMMHQANLDGTGRVLEVGTAAGYEAALLSGCAQSVHTLEYDDILAGSANNRLFRLGHDNVFVYQRDGALGLPELAPYRAIIVTASAREIPLALVEQLEEGGKLVLPVSRTTMIDDLIVATKVGNEISVEILDKVHFHHLMSSAQGGWTDYELENTRRAEAQQEALAAKAQPWQSIFDEGYEITFVI